MTSPVFLVIMAGGSGTRFWPKSTSRKPKQLLSFEDADGPTLLETTLERFDALAPADQRMIVTTRALEAGVRAVVPREVEVLGEPAPRNTAPCVYWAARAVAAKDPRAIMLVMPSDHHIADVERFRATLKRAIDRASKKDELVTLGIRPTRPETGYGYLRTGDPLGEGCVKVEAFVEKPPHEKAVEYLDAGNYLWNGGMFVWRAEVILEAFDRWVPEMRKAWDAAGGDVERAYPALPATSVDYAVMERADNVVTFPLDCGWDDLGSWTSLENLHAKDASRGGVIVGGETVAVDSSGNIVDAPGRVVALLGVSGLIVVEHNGVLLVADKSRAQDVKKVVDAVKAKRPDLA